MFRTARSLLLLVALPTGIALAQRGPDLSRVPDVRRLAAAGDHAGALALADSLAARFPGHPNTALIRAVALATAGHTADAAAEVRRLLRWDPRYARRALQDSMLVSVRAHVRTEDVAAPAARADRPLAHARLWATIAETDLVPEGTAWDSVTGTTFVGSMNKDRIVAIARDGSVRDFVARGAGGLRSPAGIHVEPARRILWAASNARFDRDDDTTRSALLAFDATTGAPRARYHAPPDGPRFLNDITTSRDGTVFVTDSRARRVWLLRPGANALEPYAPLGAMLGPNGITISTDDRHLFVADVDHIRVVELASGRAWRLTVPDTINVSGIDGLAFAGNDLIAHHWGVFWRIARYPLDAARRAIVGRELLEANTADSRTSTTGEVAGGEYVFIGNSQLDRMNTRTIDSARMDPIRMYRVSLRPRAEEVVGVALSGRDSVALLDAHSLDRLATIEVGRNPHELSASPDGRRLYVADAGDTSVTVIDVGARAVAATWFLPDTIRVHDVEASADGTTLWAASGDRRVVLDLDARSGRVRRRLPVGRAGSWMIESGGPGGALIVANLEGGAVTLLAPNDGRETVLVGAEGEIDAAAAPNGREIWSVNFRTGTLTVFDARSGRVLANTRSGAGAGRVVFTPDGLTALTVNGGDSTVVAWDVATRRPRATLAVRPGPKVIALSADGRRAYVTHPELGAVTMIDVAAMTVLASVPMPGTPDGVAVLAPASNGRDR